MTVLATNVCTVHLGAPARHHSHGAPSLLLSLSLGLGLRFLTPCAFPWLCPCFFSHYCHGIDIHCIRIRLFDCAVVQGHVLAHMTFRGTVQGCFLRDQCLHQIIADDVRKTLAALLVQMLTSLLCTFLTFPQRLKPGDRATTEFARHQCLPPLDDTIVPFPDSQTMARLLLIPTTIVKM